ncbi:hypothetical protein NP493_316g01009 [Ridgeia piscesae]|uniref:Uncharacterized protein n=1 Tax=Ridgeia piscesae TaxID=27915 RepID=A0AAD9L4L1_RIDPI|nr:hypothetical protein NP493_316g01009 [Ridgeia piscesae]
MRCQRCGIGYRKVFMTDSNGCRVCKCRSRCELAHNHAIFVLQFLRMEPRGTRMEQVARMVITCPPLRCQRCSSGYRNVFTTDSNGCRVCKCRSRCENMRCPPGRKCVLMRSYTSRRLRPVCIDDAMSPRTQVCLEDELQKQKKETSLHSFVERYNWECEWNHQRNDRRCDVPPAQVCLEDELHQQKKETSLHRYLNVAVSSNGTTGNANGTTNGTTDDAMSPRPQVCLEDELHQQKKETSLHRYLNVAVSSNGTTGNANGTTNGTSDDAMSPRTQVCLEDELHKQKKETSLHSFVERYNWECEWNHQRNKRYLNVAVSSNGTTGNANGTTNGTTDDAMSPRPQVCLEDELHQQKKETSLHRYLNVAVSSNGTTGNANGTTNGTSGEEDVLRKKVAILQAKVKILQSRVEILQAKVKNLQKKRDKRCRQGTKCVLMRTGPKWFFWNQNRIRPICVVLYYGHIMRFVLTLRAESRCFRLFFSKPDRNDGEAINVDTIIINFNDNYSSALYNVTNAVINSLLHSDGQHNTQDNAVSSLSTPKLSPNRLSTRIQDARRQQHQRLCRLRVQKHVRRTLQLVCYAGFQCPPGTKCVLKNIRPNISYEKHPVCVGT